MRLADRFPARPAAPLLDCYASAEAGVPHATTTLPQLITEIRGDRHANAVANIRALIYAGNKDAADAAKKRLPAVSLSGSVNGRRRAAVAEGRFTHSGLLQIDLDAKDNPGWTTEAMRDALLEDPRIAAVFVSASGAGVKGVAAVPADPDSHRACFLAVEAAMRERGLTIDPACKDPVRLCFVSHDPDAVIRPTTDSFRPVELQVVAEAADQRPTKPTTRRILREAGVRDLTPDAVREMLAVIPPRPPYEEWLRIASAVWDALGEAEGTAALLAWSPEESPGEYAAKHAVRLKEVRAGTLVLRAQQHGWGPPAPTSAAAPRKNAAQPRTLLEADTDPETIPNHVFPVPSGEMPHAAAADHIFRVIAPTNRLFLRGHRVHEVVADVDACALEPVAPARFASLIETFGARVMRREAREDGTLRWRAATFPLQAADVALRSDGARTHLPRIRQLINAPVIAPATNGSTVLGPGYHAHAGGTYVTGGQVPTLDLEDALPILLEALADFDFASPGDASRAFASLISPALKFGGWIQDDFPLDLAEADQSQSGKTFRFRLIHAIYRETSAAIMKPDGGVGSLDESVSRALIAGRPFVLLDNFRGRLDSPILETALRGTGKVSARALRESADVDASVFLWQLSTNGAELTRDLANRSIITRIRKRPDDYAWAKFPEGGILEHVRAHQPTYLAAVHAVIRAWADQGCPRTDTGGHDFRGWVRSLDYIVQHIAGLPPLLEGHREEQLRTANPTLQWLRDVMRATIADGYHGTELTASDLAATSDEHNLDMPGRKGSAESVDQRVGKMLGRVFRETEGKAVEIDGMRLSRQVVNEYDQVNRKTRERKTYLIERIGQKIPSESTSEDQNFLKF
jgi:hypothetical protein